ncbi:MAG TPA: ADP-ribosylglycohydrolase family protein [Petrimonas sp.]|uniref:ADP-ribosylglycohydrolase family protein n=1 Tax=Petrimonas sp. TaxID=2023866 RepID=UPI00175E6F4B|nr:ADP-ribosylglycohydrolase family protein [Petrimonas sp.]
MKYILKTATTCLILTALLSCNASNPGKNKIIISKSELLDKIKGGWAGQVIGCTYGGPTEFRWNDTMIDDSVTIPWDDTRMLWYYENVPGLYDDVYMDLTFVNIFEKYGLDAPDSLHALAFAHAEYPLWHANQAARYNILNGIMPPASGHWKNNPHADDIDFQIEADFAGLMSPGMVNSATAICDRIGHIMNYGDGLYGGVYVAAMYSLAFIYDDIEFIVEEALKTIPAESEFYQCIADIIKWYKNNPNDWKSAWFEAQKKWTHDKGCPDGVFEPFNIDAKINAAYIVIGLLYGKGDYGATIDISTRCGYDSDCNPANAAGILGTMIGYSNIPDYWRQGLEKVESMNFQYTDMSLNKVYDIGFRHAVEMIKRNGGTEKDNSYIIKYQIPQTGTLEVGFEGIYPTERRNLNDRLTGQTKEFAYEIEGCGFVLSGYAAVQDNQKDEILEADLYIDNNFIETIKMPTQSLIRKLEVAWNYDLPEGKHTIKLKAKNILENHYILLRDIIVYSEKNPGKQLSF